MTVSQEHAEERTFLLDFTLATDEWSVWVHFDHLFRQRTIGAGIGRSGQNHRQVEQLAKLSVSHDVLLVEGRVPIASKLVEANLEIKNEQELE
jgi:hypothetical protein